MQGENVLITKRVQTDFTAPGHSQSFIIQMWALAQPENTKVTGR